MRYWDAWLITGWPAQARLDENRVESSSSIITNKVTNRIHGESVCSRWLRTSIEVLTAMAWDHRTVQSVTACSAATSTTHFSSYMKVHVAFTCIACNVIGSGVLEIFADINKFDLLRRSIESILHIVRTLPFFFYCGLITMNERTNMTTRCYF